MNVTQVLDKKKTNISQQLIGILRWEIELGKIDIMAEVRCLSQHLAEPSEGHLIVVCKIFKYLSLRFKNGRGRMVFNGKFLVIDSAVFNDFKYLSLRFKNGRGRMVFNGKFMVIDSAVFNDFNTEEWMDFYSDARKEYPTRMPEPFDNLVHVLAYVDANHAGNMKTRRSHSGILMYVNQAPIIWYSKRQNTVEASSFGSEYIALRICTEVVEALRYKLKCFEVPVEGPADVLCDNRSVVTNSSVPTSVLNKRHNAICYHCVREPQAAGIIRVDWIEAQKNVADLFTKTTLSNESK